MVKDTTLDCRIRWCWGGGGCCRRGSQGGIHWTIGTATREPLSRTRLTLLTLLTPPVLVIVKPSSVNTALWSSWQSRSLKRPEWIDLVQFLGTHRPFPAPASRNVTLSFFFTNDSASNSKKKQRWLSFSKRKEQRRTPRRTLKYFRHNLKTGHS